MLEYDHSRLSLSVLHSRGIRSLKELKEVIEGHSFADEQFIEELGYNVIRFVGFTSASRALKVACTISGEGKLVTLDARIPTVAEIISDFCKFC